MIMYPTNLTLCKLREEKGYSQEFVAAQLGTSQSTYSRIESGQRPLKAKELVAVSSLYNISIDKLLDGGG
ncbi:helix-turn-helix domain-containing protein [Arundinibacter roseus]|nr:helix-turn-helix transcriptional regulator [Arundinibacter roseus]